MSDDLLKNPTVAYDLNPKLDYLTVLSSLGCPFHCEYCASNLLQPNLRQMEPGLFVQHLASLLPLLGKDKTDYNIAFMDDALLARPKSHILPILKQLKALSLPLRFHCPNGLHVRFISPQVAESMYANHFEMIRLSYESATEHSMARKASDNKLTEQHFLQAIQNLEHAGYKRSQLQVYILIGLPQQSLQEIQASAQRVHQLGLQVRLCQYSPIPGTKIFDHTCRDYAIDPWEPLLHNNSILPAGDRRITPEIFAKFKNQIQQWNRQVMG